MVCSQTLTVKFNTIDLKAESTLRRLTPFSVKPFVRLLVASGIKANYAYLGIYGCILLEKGM